VVGSDTSKKLRLENVVAVVTGGSRGIGAGIVRRLVQEGARVAFSDLLLEKGEALEKVLGSNVAFYRADSMSPPDIESLMNFAVGHFGKLDCVVNNAGAGGEGGPIAEISVEGFDRTIALLLRGSFLGIKYAVPHMQSGGTIINIASVAGLAGGWGPHPYCAAKFGVIGLTKSAALELAERGIRVNAVCPGGIATSIFAAAVSNLPEELVERAPEIVEPWIAERYPLGRSGFPADIANAVLWLASSEASFVTGHALAVDSGITAGRPWSQQNQSYELLRERFRSAMAQTTPQSGYHSAKDP
jgi:NAD(P)-dependent dehydrogenase (short-subunit alcohol dehydrogenase family)